MKKSDDPEVLERPKAGILENYAASREVRFIISPKESLLIM
jgi:hypothetical protein